MTGAAEPVWVALCTVPDLEAAVRLGRLAVRAGHAACASLVPGVRSIYHWEGDVRDEPEVLVIFKTTAGGWPALADLVRRSHPYQVPELVGLPVSAGLETYLAWVRETVAGANPGTAADARVDSSGSSM